MRVGCAGWAIGSAVASHFPGEGSHLERYARVFSCVEINSSFYRPHQAKTYGRWAASVPDAFRFSVKMPRTVTHELRLEKVDVPLQAFLHEISSLGEKLGCILVQLPPGLVLDVRVAAAFFSLLRACTEVPVVCEPRHRSWFTAAGAAVLRDADISHVWADPPPVKDLEPHDDRERLYLRLHGSPQTYYSAYDDAFIEGISHRMRLARDEGRDTWCIFDNTARGEAIPNALALMKHLSA